MAKTKTKTKRKKWHRNPRGGKSYAHYVGKRSEIRRLEIELAKQEKALGKRWNPVAYHGDMQFTSWWSSGFSKRNMV